ncbi:MAG: endolytic transglycosylase MltG [Microthrixaceae bacterium]
MLPPPTSGGRRLLAIGGLSLLVLGIVLGGLLIWASRQMNPSGPQGEAIESVVVPSGATTDDISAQLAEAGVISNSRMFSYYVGWKNAGPWNAGEYVEFRKESSFDEAIAVLDDGPVPIAAKVVRVTEGTRLVDALAAISQQMGTLSVEQLQQTLDSGQVVSAYKPADVGSWEGLLFPDTYEFEEAATAQTILQTMATKMESVLDELGYDKAEALQGRSPYELVTIASLIEKETGAPPEERGQISRVISNRLDEGETLGIDASVLYGLDRSSGELTKSDLDKDTPYNTRLNKGLPPTPIALPGRASLEAAIAPAEGTWRYYVLTSNDPPAHFFTDDYDEFLDARDDARDRGVF